MPTNIDHGAAQARAVDGMDRCAEKAGAEWQERAYAALLAFVTINPNRPFTAEEMRAETRIQQPHDARAWGKVFQIASRRGMIRRIGYAPAASSNNSPKPVWIKSRS